MGILSRISGGKRSFRYSFSNKSCCSLLLPPKILNRTPHLHSHSLTQCNFSTGSSSYCGKRDYSNRFAHRKQPFLQPNNSDSSYGLPPNYHFVSIPPLKLLSFSNSSCGFSSISGSFWKGSSPVLLKSSSSSSSSSNYICSVAYRSYFRVQKPPYDGRFFGRFFSVVPSSSGGSNSIASVASESESGGDCNTTDILESLEGKCSTQMRRKGVEVNLSPTINSKVVEIIKSGGRDNDMESKLSLVGSRLRIESVTEIFAALNRQKISGLRFFRWIRNNNPRWHLSAEVCSLIINNCGCLGDYVTMESLLGEFKSEKICLDENAFGFLSAFSSSQDSLMESVRRVIDLLDEVGGSCCSSGICALVEMFCNLDMFEMAKFVIEITGKKDSLYNILIRQRCKRGHLEEARGIIMEMNVPTAKTYNYLLGSLCKNDRIAEAYSLVEEMEKKGVPLDAITFEILIHNSCVHGKVDIAKRILDKMARSNIEPRLSTHAAFLKTFFRTEQYEEAHNYAIDSSVKYKQASAEIYSLLADLHRGKGHLMAAQGIIVELMDKGLRPSFRVYSNIVKQLQKAGRGHLAGDLKNSIYIRGECTKKDKVVVLGTCCNLNKTRASEHWQMQMVLDQ